MKNRTIQTIVAISALVLASSCVAAAQAGTTVTARVNGPADDWQEALTTIASDHKVAVVTVDQPDRKQKCHIQSFTADKLVCSRAIGAPRTFSAQQVVAIILPGVHGRTLAFFLGFNGGLGASIWGTVVLAAACPACAVGTGIAALVFFELAGLTAFTGEDQPDKLLYLAPNHELSLKLGYVQR